LIALLVFTVRKGGGYKLQENTRREIMKNILIFSAIFFTTGAVYASLHLSYKIGYKEGVIATEKCLDNWGMMKHDGWDFYCLH
jgi:hypothetical protein